ncbi:MAG TPA: hypothetical protein V6C85_22300 [Allocoleopsis sp.]
MQSFDSFFFPQITLSFSPDGKTLLAGGGYKPYRVWSLATGQMEATIGTETNWSGAMVFSPDGKTLMSGTQNGITVWQFAGQH